MILEVFFQDWVTPGFGPLVRTLDGNHGECILEQTAHLVHHEAKREEEETGVPQFHSMVCLQ